MPDAPRTQLAPLAARALLTHIQLAIAQQPQVPFHSAGLQLLVPLSVCTTWVALYQVQNLSLALVKLHTIGDCPSLKFVNVSRSSAWPLCP